MVWILLSAMHAVTIEEILDERQLDNTNRPHGRKPYHYKEDLEFNIEKHMFALHKAMYQILDACKDEAVDVGFIEEQAKEMNQANQRLAMTGRGIEFPKVTAVHQLPQTSARHVPVPKSWQPPRNALGRPCALGEVSRSRPEDATSRWLRSQESALHCRPRG